MAKRRGEDRGNSAAPPEQQRLTATSISADLATARSALEACEEAVKAASQQYDAALDIGRDAALDARQALTEAEVGRDVARRAVEKIMAELAHAEEEEAEQRRIEALEAARSRSTSATAALLRYPVLAAEIAGIIAEVAAAEQAVAAVNADLPAGYERLPAVERSARSFEGEVEHVISREEFQAWVEPGDAMPTSIDVAHVRVTAPGRGVIEVRGMPRKDWPQVELREFVRETFVPRLGVGSAGKLANEVSLPGFRSCDPFVWKPIEYFEGIIAPDDVLRQADRLRMAGRKVEDRTPEVRVIPKDRSRVKLIAKSDEPAAQRSPWG